MSATLPFLQALGLDHDTDERAVRRAYAQRLKLIDLDTDPHGFQQLRDHYEHALQWLAYTLRQRREEEAAAEAEQQRSDAESPAAGGVEGAAVATPAFEAAAEPEVAEAPQARERDADELVFESFLKQDQLVFQSEDDARKALDAALDDERLINLSARGTFEGRIAALLMNGWKPGHEFLFGPACDRFDWERNARQLQAYGQLGAAINAAINEKLIFFRQDVTHFNQQRNVIRELRWNDAPSSTEQLVSVAPQLRVLVQRYPNWLQAIAPSAHIRHWLKLYEELPAHQRELKLNVAQQQRADQGGRSSVPPPKKKWYQFGSAVSPSAWHIIWIVLALARCVSYMAPDRPSHGADLDDSQTRWYSPAPGVPPQPVPKDAPWPVKPAKPLRATSTWINQPGATVDPMLISDHSSSPYLLLGPPTQRHEPLDYQPAPKPAASAASRP